MLNTLNEKLRCFGADENGGVTVEFLLWMPLMVLMLTMTTDATLMMHEQQNMYNAARDAARQVALGQKTDEEARIDLSSRLGIEGSVVTVAQANGFVTATVSAPSSEIAKLSGIFVDATLSAEVSMWVENNES